MKEKQNFEKRRLFLLRQLTEGSGRRPKGVVLALLFILLFALSSSAQIRIWQMGSQDTLNVNQPVGTMIESDGDGSFRFIAKADITTEARIDTVVVEGSGANSVLIICYPDACDTFSLYQLFDTTLVDTSNFATWQALEDTTAMILSLIPGSQSLSSSKTDETVTVNISGGTGTSFSVADNDNDPTNELPDSVVVDSSAIIFYYRTQSDTIELRDIVSNALDSVRIRDDGFLCFYADSTIIDSVPLKLSGDQITIADTSGYFTDTTVEGVLKEIWEQIITGGGGDSIYDANSAQWLHNGDTIPEISVGGGLTSVEYDNLETDLIGTVTNNTWTWNVDGAPVIYCSMSSSGTVSFSNPRVNKFFMVRLTLSSGATPTWPASAEIQDGSATLADGTFNVYIHCVSSSIYIVSITKEAS